MEELSIKVLVVEKGRWGECCTLIENNLRTVLMFGQYWNERINFGGRGGKSVLLFLLSKYFCCGTIGKATLLVVVFEEKLKEEDDVL